MFLYFNRYLMLFLCIFVLPVKAFSLDEKLLTLSLDANSTQQGKVLFERYCAGCHKKDLSGAAGFNLKDSEWIHGSKPSQILNNLQNGFSKMPGFGAAIKSEDQHAIIAYILSKREGFENLTYELYQLDSVNDVTIDAKDKVKSGVIKHNFMDFELPEMPHYALVFEGDFHAPKNREAYLFAEGVKDFNIELEIDHQPAKNIGNSRWVKRWQLKPGKQHIKFTYISGKSGLKWSAARNISLYVVNDDNTIKIFPVSTKARKLSKNTGFDVKASDQYVIQQKKIVKLPPYSIAVGAPEKINYAFNTRSCAINGLWSGDLLNVGPNIGGRGKDGSIPLGDWLYHFPSQLAPSLSEKQECKFLKYRVEGSPEFYFSVDNVVMSVVAKTTVKNTIEFVYRILENPEKRAQLSFSLPDSNKVKVTSVQGDINNNTLVINITEQAEFSVQLTWKGEKKC